MADRRYRMMNFKNYLRCVCLLGLFFCFGGAFVDGADSVDVVFVGNSYTYANGMVDIFKGIVESVRGGGVDVGKLSDSRVLAGGATLQRHWLDPKKKLVKQIGSRVVNGKLKSVKRDFVVLQEQSQGALKPASRARMFKYAKLICREAKANGAQSVFFMTWARRSTFGKDGKGKMSKRQFMYEVAKDGKSVIVDPKVMSVNERIVKTHRVMADALAAKVAPCGVAFAKAIKAGIAVHSEKEKYGSHPNVNGSYLIACVFYGTIYDRDPEEIPDDVFKKVSAKMAAKLQEIAKEAVDEEKKRKAKRIETMRLG
jgi:hypothetical protein